LNLPFQARLSISINKGVKNKKRALA